jgi:hypothetical protein
MRRFVGLLVLSGSVAAWADTGRVNVDRANVRSRPGARSAVLATLPLGTELEVLARQGEWLKVKQASGLEGFILARLVTVVPAPPSTTPAPPPPAAAPPAPPLAIEHKALACVVAGRHPQVSACFQPADQVGRARVTFRAAGTDPWFAVDMAGSGCAAALLPKPKREIPSFQYFVEVIDRSFTARQEPASAPDRSHQPRVVKSEGECRELAGLVQSSQAPSPLVVRAVRDASGRVLDSVAARALEAQASISGFSTEGVVLGEASPAGQPSASAAGAGGSKTLLIVGGAAAAAGAVALAAGGGSDSGGGAAPAGLSGRWVGSVAEGTGITFEGSSGPVLCVFRWDTTVDLTQSGDSINGSGSSVGRSATCTPSSPEVEAALRTIVGNTGSGTLTGSAANGQMTLTTSGDGLVFTGSYTSSRIDLRATVPDPGGTFVWTWRMTKR